MTDQLMNAKATEWPDMEKPQATRELHDAVKEASAGYLRFIAWWIGISMTVIIGGAGFFLTKVWEKVGSIESSLTNMSEQTQRTSRRMAFIEIINRELAEKNGLNIHTLEKLRDLQERQYREDN